MESGLVGQNLLPKCIHKEVKEAVKVGPVAFCVNIKCRCKPDFLFVSDQLIGLLSESKRRSCYILHILHT